MKKLLTTGRIIFALGMIALGVLCFIFKDFIVGRPPAWPAGLNINPALGYISGALLVIAAIAVLINKKAGEAALAIAVLILALSVCRHIPAFMNDWGNAYKSMALFGGALIVAASFFNERNTGVYASAGTERIANKDLVNGLVMSGSILLAAFFVVGGYAHFKYADFVNTLIPDYIPYHSFFTYACGVCLFAGGIGILIPPIQKWAALWSGIMVAGWFLLLHIPRFIKNTNDTSDRLGLCESFCFAGIFFVLAAMFSRKT
jgi:uncharacterized membrane protein